MGQLARARAISFGLGFRQVRLGGVRPRASTNGTARRLSVGKGSAQSTRSPHGQRHRARAPVLVTKVSADVRKACTYPAPVPDKYFTFIFTKEDCSNIPTITDVTYRYMNRIQLTVEGIASLIKKT